MQKSVLNRFYQTMVSLSDDCNMPVYTYLLRDFDGVAVKVDDEDLLPAKDLIIKNQAIRKYFTIRKSLGDRRKRA